MQAKRVIWKIDFSQECFLIHPQQCPGLVWELDKVKWFFEMRECEEMRTFCDCIVGCWKREVYFSVKAVTPE